MDEKEILSLEKQFWTSMAAGDHEKSSQLIAPRSAMVGAMGAHTFSPSEYIEMSKKSPFKILDWSITEEQVYFPTPETAVCIYQVDQEVELNGKNEKMSSTDSSVWAKTDGDWKCILHTEFPITSKKQS